MEYLLYLVKSLIVSATLYGYYHFFLRNRGFHRFNRVYLLTATVLSLSLPLLTISFPVISSERPGALLSNGLGGIPGGFWEERSGGTVLSASGPDWWQRVNGWWALYLTGLVVSLVMLMRSIFYIVRIRRRYRSTQIGDVRFFETREKAAPFSFFRWIFWHERIAFSSREGQQIFRHELYHVQQGHSFDLIWMEIVCAAAWFNPFFHAMRKELTTVHEFLADESAISASDPLDYAELLVVQSIGIRQQRPGSAMFSPTIKRRVDMIMRLGNPRSGVLRRIMTAPLVLVLVGLVAFRTVPATRSGVGGAIRPAAKPFTVVVDAGHGGVDPGAINSKGVMEKDMTLLIVRTIDRLAAQYNINVILTRNSDILPGDATDKMKGLENRVTIAQQSRAAAFISIHVNQSTEEAPKVDTATGMDAYISKDRKDGDGLKLANDILQHLSKIYTVTHPVLQRDEHIYVLDHNTCPSVLVECGYLGNPTDLDFIQQESNREAIARAILQSLADMKPAS